MREIILDTETTGLDPVQGHRIVEIGCVEVFNLMPTGREFHRWVHPERDIPEDAFRVHGLTAAFLADKPRFYEIAEEFLAFVGDAALIIHNAAFDLAFLNHELRRASRPVLGNVIVDTLELARRAYPTVPNSLDALCKRFGIDLGGRVKHGALIDCTLLADVYLELRGGRQPGLGLGLDARSQVQPSSEAARTAAAARPVRLPRAHAPSEAEFAAHVAFLASIKDPLWLAA